MFLDTKCKEEEIAAMKELETKVAEAKTSKQEEAQLEKKLAILNKDSKQYCLIWNIVLFENKSDVSIRKNRNFKL